MSRRRDSDSETAGRETDSTFRGSRPHPLAFACPQNRHKSVATLNSRVTTSRVLAGLPSARLVIASRRNSHWSSCRSPGQDSKRTDCRKHAIDRRHSTFPLLRNLTSLLLGLGKCALSSAARKCRTCTWNAPCWPEHFERNFVGSFSQHARFTGDSGAAVEETQTPASE